MDNLEEDLTCSVCYSLFDDPRVLPCSHTFCKSCLDSVLQLSANFSIWRPLRLPLKCPNCRSVVELPPNGVEALPVNVSLRAIIEKYQCDSRPRAINCPEHPRQPLNVYCVQDRQLICGCCLTIGQHQGHPIDDLHTAYVKERDAPAKLVESLTDKRWTEVCALVDQLEQEKERSEGLVRRDRDAVTQFFQGLDGVLARKKAEVMSALDRAGADLSLAYEPLIEKLKSMKAEQLELINLSSSVEEEESALDFLEKVHQLQQRVNTLVQTPLPKVTPFCISPSVGDFLAEHWPRVTIGGLEQVPVPKFACKPRGHLDESSAPTGCTQSWTRTRLVPATLTVLLLLFTGLYLERVGTASLDLSFLSHLSHLLHNLTEEFTVPFLETASLHAALDGFLSGLSSLFATVGETTYQHVAFVFKTLRLL
ncbi:tripartite motif-containing protein 59 [Denticeps clupeoides]|uniref:Tripartite motif-containing protein 59 n=1 Tax=Denticeps clupeoides TaxID=299321 RepID=A0AAY4E451_9TELE|nr:tripartite motif-containing protein 59 [Denticeps clupeoides]XP_028818413.1 tripartite motif-containing protein 59 [Denticeps clupeoides]XP_028818414.1 tripartite motif-containing protein 59 [Denticeps clupeoides]XP_028818416.1 tripartite motif-containing protein 59 [Denticeps clupeoides]